jgi:hypothetical protein
LEAHDIRIARLGAQLTLPREAHAWIPHAVMLPLAPVASGLAEHGSRMKGALEKLRPGVVDFGVGMLASMGAAALVHALGGGRGATRTASRQARKLVQGHRGGTRFSGFLETTVASLLEVRTALASVAPQVQARAHVALLALYGGAISYTGMHLVHAGADVVSVDFDRGRLQLRLQRAAAAELTRFARAAVEQVDSALSRGDWGRATTIAEEALAVFAPYPERWEVILDGKPAAIVLNEVRSSVLWRASLLAQPRGPAAVARILLDLVSRAPFLWEGSGDVPRAADVARDLLALETVVDAGGPRDAARDALFVLAQRTEAAKDHGMDVAAVLQGHDVVLVRLLAANVKPPQRPSGTRAGSPGVVATFAVVRDLVRRARGAQVPVGPTVLGLRRDARRRAAGLLCAGVALGCATFFVTQFVGSAAFGLGGQESRTDDSGAVAAVDAAIGAPSAMTGLATSAPGTPSAKIATRAPHSPHSAPSSSAHVATGTGERRPTAPSPAPAQPLPGAQPSRPATHPQSSASARWL